MANALKKAHDASLMRPTRIRLTALLPYGLTALRLSTRLTALGGPFAFGWCSVGWSADLTSANRVFTSASKATLSFLAGNALGETVTVFEQCQIGPWVVRRSTSLANEC